jgi:hypothetical protein
MSVVPCVDGVVFEVQLETTPPLTFHETLPPSTGLPRPPTNVAVKVRGVPTTAVVIGESVKVSAGVSAARFTDKVEEVFAR